MGPWVQPSDLLQRVADALHVAVGSLITAYTRQATTAINNAYSDIRRRMVEKGYSDAQLDAWDDNARFNSDLALFWLLKEAAGLGGYDQEQVQAFDHRKELASPGFVIFINGAPTQPANANSTNAPLQGGNANAIYGPGSPGCGPFLGGGGTLRDPEISSRSTFFTQADRRRRDGWGNSFECDE